MNIITRITRKGKMLLAGAVLAMTLAAASTVTPFNSTVLAEACDKVNIVYCGINGSNASEYISSFKSIYNKNNDNGHQDLPAVFSWSGLSGTEVSSMSTSNTKVGTLYRNGNIKVDDKVVATGAWVSARFTEGEGFVKVKDGVWARKTTTSLKYDTYKLIVRFNSDGTFDSAVMVDCGNAVKATNAVQPPAPTPPPVVTPVLKCVSLKGVATTSPLTYVFTATASAENTKIVSYNFNFGETGTESKTVVTAATSASATHTFSKYNTTYTVVARVTGTHATNVSSPACVFMVKTPAAPVTPTLVCTKLTKNAVAGKDLTYSFTGSAVANPATAITYVFDFGDNTPAQTVVASGSTATSAEHTFVDNGGSYTVRLTVSSKDVTAITSETCAVKVTMPEDQPCVPTATQDENCKEVPEELFEAGPGAVAGLFAGASTIGTAAYQFILRRRK